LWVLLGAVLIWVLLGAVLTHFLVVFETVVVVMCPLSRLLAQPKHPEASVNVTKLR